MSGKRALRRVALGAVVVLAACGPKSSDNEEVTDGSTTSSGGTGAVSGGSSTSPPPATSTSVQTTDSSTGSPPSTTGPTGKDDCKGLAYDECNSATAPDGLPCSWESFATADPVGDTCVMQGTLYTCVKMSGDDTGGTCTPTPGCEESDALKLYYRDFGDGTVLVGDYCGRSPPAGWQECESGHLGVMPPECACPCEATMVPGPGTTGG